MSQEQPKERRFYNSPDGVYRLIWDAIEEEDQGCWAFKDWRHFRDEVSGMMIAVCEGVKLTVEATDLAELHKMIDEAEILFCEQVFGPGCFGPDYKGIALTEDDIAWAKEMIKEHEAEKEKRGRA